MIILSLKLLIAHILGDFVFQPYKWVKDKKDNKYRSKYLYLHAGVHALALVLMLGFNKAYWIGVIVIVITHLIIDLLKVYLENKSNVRLLFIIDQIAHLTIIAMVVHLYQPYTFTFEAFNNPKLLLFIIAILSVTIVSSIIMKIFMQPFNIAEMKSDDEENKSNSLANAGNYIGILERLFVFGFIVIQQWQVIGFLFAAKSVFRFNDLSQGKDRKLTEYILIGTLMSFGLAILIGITYMNLVARL
jgi:hypothetical protein